ncbi:LysM peptidoglycan-binding domain-containing protein [Solitalea sp. MAHUQ-68]|uniref:LysM peptidoglycan-binding domain-containing protein n=1 Tax=Solitalea agri TaxID=2953739 RepID=A0A9X2F5B6_9SPHI|nr:LysM peptidoglycan-binding domain-containing protein [Solitalea agri]MCO4294454.1 LysM peptidoglycan-binding domain-containing protein [Solitalea agri]
MASLFGNIEKLYIQAYKDADLNEPVGDRFYALINPETYTYKYRTEFCETQAAGTSGVALKFSKIPPQDFNFDFLFDGTGAFKDAAGSATTGAASLKLSVHEQLDDFKKKLFEYNGEKHRPNYLKIIWGTLLFKGVLISLDIEFKLFKPDGTPIRAIAKCTFKGTVTEELRVARENAQSPDITHERTITASDRLSLMANKIYGNQSYYTDVAAFNRLDGFRKIKPGVKVFFPKID